MKITYDPAKRARTLRERGLDFETAPRCSPDHETKRPTIGAITNEDGRLAAGLRGGGHMDATRRWAACHFDEESQ
jgi:uncharacterized DUF497 family protein